MRATPIAAVLLLAACSVLPPRAPGPAHDQEVTVVYELTQGARPLRIPASDDHLTVLDLRAEPAGAREVFTDGRRSLLPPAVDRLVLRCRYRLLPRFDTAGRMLPPPTPHELFPGATSIHSAELRHD
jgi:hypothetical protein